jgi:hypothetical protein
MNLDTSVFLFGLLCAGLGAIVTGLFWAAAVEREAQARVAAERLRRQVRSTSWTEARW